MTAKLTKEEQEILDSFENGEWVPVADLPERRKELAEYARNTLKKDKRLNIRISERDLTELQRKAIKEGLPYQTYIVAERKPMFFENLTTSRRIKNRF